MRLVIVAASNGNRYEFANGFSILAHFAPDHRPVGAKQQARNPTAISLMPLLAIDMQPSLAQDQIRQKVDPTPTFCLFFACIPAKSPTGANQTHRKRRRPHQFNDRPHSQGPKERSFSGFSHLHPQSQKENHLEFSYTVCHTFY
ncbi:hypothetical protein [Thalassospira marina]|uniref:Uncharacterized protein n=1 Tax=Thalassospira marina TaxID=2048283 RepID=A0A2N3KXD0_9PROT|nr:hypothetical protein [Thalassospira marina]PKR55143.1 hypothetical protein COO20_07140 [Thalassospira marina]